ncbi:MAG: hypothetical protein NUV40_03245 [Patescibacteria group bacterium]|nr:hypothetical protein [Patescibacteria group bacterium]
MNKEVILFSENDELFKAFKRALKAVRGVEVCKFKTELLENEKRIVLITITEGNLQELFYEEIRSKYRNPVIVTGFEDRLIFEKEHPLFYDHPYNHTYLGIPFELEELINLFNEMIPISSQPIRQAICGSDRGYKGYILTLLSHDLLKDMDRCIKILKMASNFVNDNILSAEAEKAINGIKKDDLDWPSVASKLGQKFVNIIKGN